MWSERMAEGWRLLVLINSAAAILKMCPIRFIIESKNFCDGDAGQGVTAIRFVDHARRMVLRLDFVYSYIFHFL